TCGRAHCAPAGWIASPGSPSRRTGSSARTRRDRLLGVSITGQILRVHQRIYEATDGRIGHGTIGVPTLLLRTRGRRSGATRTNALVYARDGDAYLVVASNGGADRAPAWLHNLRANPQVEIQIGR